MGFGFKSLGSRGLGFRGLGFGFKGLGFLGGGFRGLGFWVLGLGFRDMSHSVNSLKGFIYRG